MKKILALLLALTLLLSLCACTDKTPSDQIPDTTPSDSTPDIPPSTGTGGAGDENTDPWSEYQIITVAQALELCGESVMSPRSAIIFVARWFPSTMPPMVP